MLKIENKKVHFIGVGGISCNALARFVLDFGGKVSGSDAKITPICDDLKKRGAEIWQGARPEKIDADAVVFSSAIRKDDEELLRAKSLGIPIYERHEFLGEVSKLFSKSVAIAGTHGKTSTTAMLTHILLQADMPFLAMIGGECVDGGNYVNNTKVDRIESLKDCVFVTEACEYKRHMLSVKSDIGAITNIECDHPDCYSDIDSVRVAFKAFYDKSDIRVAQKNDICDIVGKGEKRDEFCVFNGEKDFSMKTSDCGAKLLVNGESAGNLILSDDGEYNYKNAVFAIAIADQLGLPVEFCVSALKSFNGVKRRFERGKDICGAKVFFDFAHHPSEIECVIERAKKYGEAMIVFQPHTYSRTKAYLEDFVNVIGGFDFAKRIVIMPTYAARETASMGVGSDVLATAIFDKFPQKQVYLAENARSTIDYVKLHANEVDVVLMIGAGDIYELKGILHD